MMLILCYNCTSITVGKQLNSFIELTSSTGVPVDVVKLLFGSFPISISYATNFSISSSKMGLTENN